jgi:hypothetical protein
MLRQRLAVILALAAVAVSAVPAVASPGGAPLYDGSRAAPAAGVQTAILHTTRIWRPAAVGKVGADRKPHAVRRAGAVATASAVLQPAVAAGQEAVVSPAGGSPCFDRARSFTGGRWQETYRWTFRARSTPDGLSQSKVIRVLNRAVENITDARNDCGRPDSVAATAEYLGTSNHKPSPTSDGEHDACAPRDGFNAVGFGRLRDGVAGLTCVWTIGDRIVEADIKLDRRARWATSLDSCSFASMLEAVATHEFGHVFGLGHVSESRHGRLTMSERLDGFCQNSESTLGLGDMKGLEQLY